MSDKIEQARALKALGRNDAAQQLLAEVLATDPDNALALTEMASVCAVVGEYARSLEYSASAVRRAPESSFAWRVRAYAAFRLTGQTSPEFAQSPDLTEVARGSVRRALEIDPEDADNHVVYAAVYARTDPTAALGALDRALELDPEHLSALHQRAFINRTELGYYDRSADDLREVLRLDPQDDEAFRQLGVVYAKQGNLDAAITHLRASGRLNPERSTDIRKLIELLLAEQRVQQARSQISAGPDAPAPASPDVPVPAAPPQRVSPHAMVLEPALVEELRGRNAERWHSTAPADVDKAVAVLAELRQADPENADLLYESALADWLCGRRRAAITRLRKVSQLDPGRAELVNAHLARLEAEEEQAAEAKAAERKAEHEAERAAQSPYAKREAQARQQEQQAESEVERAAEAAIKRREARERAKARRAREGRPTSAELDAAVRAVRPDSGRKIKRHWLVVVPLLILGRLLLHSCSTDTASHPTPPAPNWQSNQWQQPGGSNSGYGK